MTLSFNLIIDLEYLVCTITINTLHTVSLVSSNPVQPVHSVYNVLWESVLNSHIHSLGEGTVSATSLGLKDEFCNSILTWNWRDCLDVFLDCSSQFPATSISWSD